ncbi:MAG: magnesium transporter MgtE N-terminal domain-containing protein, partial [Acidobacteriota bacterium]
MEADGKQHFEELREWIAKGEGDALLNAFADLHPADAAEKLAELEPEEVARYVELVGAKRALEIFEFVPFELQRETLNHL